MTWWVRGGIGLIVVVAACAAQKPPAETPVAADAEAPAAVTAPVEETAPAVAAEPEAPFLGVEGVSVEPSGSGRRLVIRLSRTPEAVHDFTLNGPPRVVIDVAGGELVRRPGEAKFPVEDDLVSRVRAAPFQSRLRVVLDLRRHEGHYAIRQDGRTLVAELGEVETAAAPPPTLLAAATAVAEPPPAQPVVAPPPPPPPTGSEPTGPPPRLDRPQFHGEKISLDFKDADIQNVLRVLADVSGLNIIATDDVKGKVTLHLVDVPWDQALDLVMRSNRLEMTREGNVVRISTVSRLKEEREALRAAQEAEKELEPLQVRYVKVNYARADEALVDKVKGVLTDRGTVTFDSRTNTVIVRDIPRGIHDAEGLVRELDVQSPQVLIEAHLVEATEDFARGLGVQWGYQQTATTGHDFVGTVVGQGSGLGSGVSGTPFLADFPVPANFASGFGPNNGSALDLTLGSLSGNQTLNARLTALEELGKGKVISRPRVVTMNNVAATIQSLTILRVKLPSTGTVINTGTGGAAGSASTATEKINTGITLVVTPQVSSDGYVLMNIFAKSSQADFSRTVDNIPTEISREANSNVLIHDGETVVLGGIYRQTSTDNENGIPFLKNVPVIGWAFKRDLRNKHHEELLVFLTPKVVASGGNPLPAAAKLWEDRHQGG